MSESDARVCDMRGVRREQEEEELRAEHRFVRRVKKFELGEALPDGAIFRGMILEHRDGGRSASLPDPILVPVFFYEVIERP